MNLLRDKHGFVENWGLFAVLGVLGVLIMLILIKIWGRNDSIDLGMGTKIGMIIIGLGVALFFTKKIENE